jgi:glycerol-3-phosphate O-acyltransferase
MIEWIRMIWEKLRQRLIARVVEFIGNSRDQYSCYLPENTGRLSSRFLRLFYSGIKINKHQLSVIRDLPKDARIIYVSKYKSHFEHLFYHTRYPQQGILAPELALDYRLLFWQPVSRILQMLIFNLNYFGRYFSFPDPYQSGYVQRELMAGKSILFSLIDDRGFYRRFIKESKDPCRCIINTQLEMNHPIYIVPQLFLYDKKPERKSLSITDILFGSSTKPGKLRRLITLINRPDKINIEISEPLNLWEFLNRSENHEKDPDYQSLQLRRHLLDQINRHRQGITGPSLKSKQELKEKILTGDTFQEFSKTYSRQNDISLQKVRKRANGQLKKIAAKYNPAVIKVLAVIVKWIINRMFDGVTVDYLGLHRIKTISHKGPIVFIPCHKSHIDYLILSFIMYINNMPCPHIAAGENLSFWPLGTIFRRGGAFFIRRTFRGARLYSTVFNEYIHTLLAEGFNIEFFIEGGRSRTGKLILPKLGLLSTLLRAFKNNACREMLFVPVFVGYDRVIEERSYLNEIEGGEKHPETFSQVIKASKFLKRRFGKIYINFHEPILLTGLLSQSGISFQHMSNEELNSFCRNLGFRIINAIDRISVVTPHGLVAAAILNCSRERFTFEQLMKTIETYRNHLKFQNAQLSDTLTADLEHAVRQVLEDYDQNKYIECIEDEKGDLLPDEQFVINESKRPLLEYYKNNCIIFFVPAAITALSILEKDSFQFRAAALFKSYSFLQKLFKNEFAFDIDTTPSQLVHQTLSTFEACSILTRDAAGQDAYHVTSEGLRKLKCFSDFLKTYLESYWITLKYLNQQPEENVNSETHLKNIMQLGSQMFKEKEISRKEALSKVNYGNAMTYYHSKGLNGNNREEIINYHAEEIQKYLNCL